MSSHDRQGLRALAALLAAVALGFAGCRGPNQEQPSASGEPAASFLVDGQTALHALISLTDAHLQKMADVLTFVATTDAVRSAQWEQIRAPLAEAARVNVPALHWFALPDGSYWTLEGGRATANLADRPYFPRLLAGQTVMGDLVVSRATGKSAAIVAVPVRGSGGSIVGVLGSSVYLDSLSLLIQREMHLAPNHLFYSLDAEPLVGLHADPESIFLRPMEEGDADLAAAIREILDHEEGVVSYGFRGTGRTVLYRRSPATGWWYAFGTVRS
jgi:hypothetical protein